MANGSDSESRNKDSHYSDYYQATGLSDVEASSKVDNRKVVSSEYSGPSPSKQANAITIGGVKRSDEIAGLSPTKESIVSKSGGPSPAKKAFLDSLAVPTDFSNLGKRLISQIVVGAAMKMSSFRGRLIMFVKGVSPVRKLQFLSLVFLDGTGEIRATLWKDVEKIIFWQRRKVFNEVYDVFQLSLRTQNFLFCSLACVRCSLNRELK